MHISCFFVIYTTVQKFGVCKMYTFIKQGRIQDFYTVTKKFYFDYMLFWTSYSSENPKQLSQLPQKY